MAGLPTLNRFYRILLAFLVLFTSVVEDVEARRMSRAARQQQAERIRRSNFVAMDDLSDQIKGLIQSGTLYVKMTASFRRQDLYRVGMGYRSETNANTELQLYGAEGIYLGTPAHVDNYKGPFNLDVLLRFHADDLQRMADNLNTQLETARNRRQNSTVENLRSKLWVINHLIRSVEENLDPCIVASGHVWKQIVLDFYAQEQRIPIRLVNYEVTSRVRSRSPLEFNSPYYDAQGRRIYSRQELEEITTGRKRALPDNCTYSPLNCDGRVGYVTKEQWRQLSIRVDQIRPGSEPVIQNSLSSNARDTRQRRQEENEKMRCHVFGPAPVDAGNLREMLSLERPFSYARLDQQSTWDSQKALFQRSLHVANHIADHRLQSMSVKLLQKSDLLRQAGECKRMYRGRCRAYWPNSKARSVCVGSARRGTRRCMSLAMNKVEYPGQMCARAIREELNRSFNTDAFEYEFEEYRAEQREAQQHVQQTAMNTPDDPEGDDDDGTLDWPDRLSQQVEAETAGIRLVPEGFVNLMCVPQLRQYVRTPYHVPKNAIVVYKEGTSVIDNRRNDNGHIEMRVIQPGFFDDQWQRLMAGNRGSQEPRTDDRLRAQLNDVRADLQRAFSDAFHDDQTTSRVFEGFVSDYYCPLSRAGNTFNQSGAVGSWSRNANLGMACVMMSPQSRAFYGSYIY